MCGRERERERERKEGDRERERLGEREGGDREMERHVERKTDRQTNREREKPIREGRTRTSTVSNKLPKDNSNNKSDKALNVTYI